MSASNCPRCGQWNPAGALYCRRCGSDAQAPSSSPRLTELRYYFGMLIALLAAMVLIVFIGRQPQVIVQPAPPQPTVIVREIVREVQAPVLPQAPPVVVREIIREVPQMPQAAQQAPVVDAGQVRNPPPLVLRGSADPESGPSPPVKPVATAPEPRPVPPVEEDPALGVKQRIVLARRQIDVIAGDLGAAEREALAQLCEQTAEYEAIVAKVQQADTPTAYAVAVRELNTSLNALSAARQAALSHSDRVVGLRSQLALGRLRLQSLLDQEQQEMPQGVQSVAMVTRIPASYEPRPVTSRFAPSYFSLPPPHSRTIVLLAPRSR